MKRFIHVFVAFLLGCTIPVFSAQHKCGTIKMMEHLQNKNIRQVLFEAKLAQSSQSRCSDDDYYDSVYSRNTKHFQIFYTLQGPHKTTLQYIDSLEKALEYAWDFHVRQLGMRQPVGFSFTHHYEQAVKEGLYPVEVIDLEYIREVNILFDEPCYKCFGLTLSGNEDESQLFIENDFKHISLFSPQKDSVTFNGKTCSYVRATEASFNTTHEYSYAEKFMQGLRVTTVHELYHAIQLRYTKEINSNNFWFEASASGIEEVATPDIDDYIVYLPFMSKITGTPLPKMNEPYAAGILFLYLYNHIGHNTDKLIWESFAKTPTETFKYHFNQVANKKKLSADSLFHDFAIRLAFSGKRTAHTDSSFWIDDDQPLWPEFDIFKKEGIFQVDPLDEIAYRFYSNGIPDLTQFTGRASAVAVNADSYRVRFLPTSNSVDSTYTEFTGKSDFVIWVTSRFGEGERMPTVFKDSTIRAYPTPWRHGPLCFTPLPQNKDYIEIRNRRGNLVEKIKYDNYTHCLDEDQVKSLFAPGVYRFRIGSSGKLKDFIIVY